MKGFCSGIFGFVNAWLFNLKSNQPSGASGVEVKQQFETAKACGSNPAGPFFANYSFVFFRIIVRLFCRLGSRSSMVQLHSKLL